MGQPLLTGAGGRKVAGGVARTSVVDEPPWGDPHGPAWASRGALSAGGHRCVDRQAHVVAAARDAVVN